MCSARQTQDCPERGCLAIVDSTPPATPELPPTLVARDRLTSLIAAAAQQRLTLVMAPAGYGKSTALAQWVRSQRRGRVRWLTLRAAHNDPLHLAHDLSRTLTAHAGGPLHPNTHGAATGNAGTRSPFVATVLHALDELPPTTLVLDEFHVLTDMELLEQLALFVDEAPRALHFILATQVDPPPSFYHLRMSDSPIVEITQEDLAFTHREAADLVQRLTGLELTPPDLEALMEHTEGWAVGLQLAATSIQRAIDLRASIETFTRYSPPVVDFFNEHVLNRLSGEVRQFLLHTSVLRRLTGPLCDDVLRSGGSHATLEEIDRTSTFVTRLDEQRKWFRYHELLRATLRHELHCTDPDLERELLRRAAAWHLERDDAETAMTYLLEAGLWDAVLDVAFRHGRTLAMSDGGVGLARWLAQVPLELRRRRTDVMLLEAAATTFAADPTRARESLERIETDGRASEEVRFVADMIRAHLELLQGLNADARTSAERVLRRADEIRPEELPNVLGLTATPADVISGARLAQGLSLLYENDCSQARHALATIEDSSDAVWQLSAMGGIALIDAWAGRLTSARKRALGALTLANELGISRSLNTTALLALAHVAHERGDVNDAAELLEQAASHDDLRARSVMTMLTAIERAALLLGTHDERRATEHLAVLRDAERCAMPAVVLARAASADACLLLANDDREGARSILERMQDQAMTSEVRAATVRLEVESGNVTAARAALAAMPKPESPRATLEGALWHAILDWVEGKQAAALTTMIPMVSAAESERHIGVFMAAGGSALGPVRALQRKSPTPFLRTLLEGLGQQTTTRSRSTKELVEQLTDREVMVLTLLPSRLSSAEIADRLGVSLNTIKTHLKHVYRKLGVTGRQDAVTKSERLRLL